MRGKELNELPASVRTVIIAHCHGQGAVNFWEKAIGFERQHEVLREGSRFFIKQGSFDVQVDVVQAFRLLEPGNLSTAVDASKEHLLVDVTVSPVSDGLQLQACRAIGTLANQIKQFVVLSK